MALLLLKLPFAVRPGLIDSRFSKDTKQYMLSSSCSSANRQVIRIDTSQNRQDRFGVARFAKLY